MKICSNCGTQNEDSFSKCVACGGDLPITGDEATILLDPMDAVNNNAGPAFSLKTDTNTYGQEAGSQNAYAQNTYNQNSYGQNTYGQDMYGQAAGNMQNAAYGAAPSQQYYGDGMNAQYQTQQGMPGGMPYNNQQAGNWNTPPQPVKANKKAIFIALAAITLIVVAAFVIIFNFGNKGGKSSPEKVAEAFIEALNDRDIDKIEELCPPFLDAGIDDIKDTMDALELYDSEFKFIAVTDKKKCDVDEVEEDIKDYYDVSVELEDAYELEVEYQASMSYLGETYDETESEDMVVIKYKGEWFIYE